MNSAISYFKARQWAFSFIEDHGGEKEVADFLLCGQMKWNEAQLLMHFRNIMDKEDWIIYQNNVHKFVAGWPAQYLIGATSFYGLQLRVTENTLIPRPETEELVEWILNDHSNSPIDVLDLGTGTGAIGLALKTQRPQWQLTLSDISKDALDVAQLNAQMLNLNVKLIKSDLFDQLNQKFDVIVSNPPYIAEDEKQYMDQSVLEHEPHMALFASDHGLAIYKRIAREYRSYLKPHGQMYFEHGFRQAQAVSQIFKDQISTAQLETRKDINNRDRMIKVQC